MKRKKTKDEECDYVTLDGDGTTISYYSELIKKIKEEEKKKI